MTDARDVSVPTTPTSPDDLREQIPSAIADPGAFVPRAKRHGAGDQYESVPQWAARAVGSLVWPLVAEARAEADMHRRTRLRVERVLDEALGAEEKDGTGEGLAADVRLAITRRDEEIERLHAQLASAVVLPEDWREQINEFCRSKHTYTLAEALEQCFARWQAPSVSGQTPDDGDPFEIRSHAYRRANVCYECGQPPSAHVSDQTPATPDDEPATVSLCGVPHRISCNLVTEADEQWCTCDGPQRVGEALLDRLNGLSSVQGDTTPEEACVHGQTADLTGLAARENRSDR